MEHWLMSQQAKSDWLEAVSHVYIEAMIRLLLINNYRPVTAFTAGVVVGHGTSLVQDKVYNKAMVQFATEVIGSDFNKWLL